MSSSVVLTERETEIKTWDIKVRKSAAKSTFFTLFIDQHSQVWLGKSKFPMMNHIIMLQLKARIYYHRLMEARDCSHICSSKFTIFQSNWTAILRTLRIPECPSHLQHCSLSFVVFFLYLFINWDFFLPFLFSLDCMPLQNSKFKVHMSVWPQLPVAAHVYWRLLAFNL